MGIEPRGNSPKKAALLTEGGAKPGALDPKSTAIDPALTTLIDAWPTLPDAIRAGILALVQAAGR
jgi:hypothetical protein